MILYVATAIVLAAAGPYQGVFDDATAAYQQGDYYAAAQGYERLVGDRVASPAVFYNLGNSYYRLGKLGAAIANYERALQLEPGFESARENLEKCVRETKRHLQRPLPPAWERSLLFWHYDLGKAMTLRLAMTFWGLFWALFALRQWRRLPGLNQVLVAAGVVAIALGASAWVKAHPPLLAVAVADAVPVRYGTTDDATVRFELYEGDRATVEEQRGDWLRVRTVDGERGWARHDDILLVGPPYEAGPADRGV